MLRTVEDTCTEENYRNLLERIFGPRFKTFGNFKNRSEIHMLWCGNISFSEFLTYFLYKPIYYWRNSSLRFKKKDHRKTTRLRDSSVPAYFAMWTGKQVTGVYMARSMFKFNVKQFKVSGLFFSDCSTWKMKALHFR